jgi:branched-chain amino acid transport system ATP-binding protein
VTVTLRTENVTKKFGGVIAVNNISIKIKKGSVTAIIGPNGAGKTTLLNLISGVLYPDKGKIFFEEKDITKTPPYRRARLGIARTFQNISIIPSLTVFENVISGIIGINMSNNIMKLFDTKQINKEANSIICKKAYEILDKVKLSDKALKLAIELTRAEQRVLDIALALATEPRLLLLDEPTSGLAYEDIPHIVNLIKDLKKTDHMLTIILVEHKLDVVKDLADKVIVMSEGKILTEGSYNDVINNRDVIEMYLGEEYVESKKY